MELFTKPSAVKTFYIAVLNDMYILCTLLSIFILLSSSNAYPQDDLSAFSGQIVLSIKAISSIGISERDIAKDCEIKIGDPLSLQSVRECVISYYQKGLFKDVTVEAYKEGKGIGLQFLFIEKMRVENIKITGNSWFSTKRLKSIIGLKKGDELKDTRITEVQEVIMDLYRRSGFFDISVKIDSVSHGVDQVVDIVIRIDEKKRAEVADIVFNGDKVFEKDKLKPLMKIHKGDYYDEKDVDSSIKALEKYYVDKGHPKVLINPPEILYDETKGEVIITLSIEAGTHVEVMFEGVQEMDTEILKKELLIWKERTFDNSVLDESADRLIQYYRQNGYYFATVTYSIEKLDDKNIKVVFKITEGLQVTIKEIHFRGNSYLEEKRLKGYLDIREGEFLIEDVLKEDIKEILYLYKSRGFLDVKTTPDITFDKDDKTLSIYINIQEGEQTFISNIGFEGNNAFSRNEIMARIKSRERQPYNEAQVIDDLYSIQSFYVQKGYIYASVDLKSTFSPDKKDVIIDYVISEDKPVYTGNINVIGNSTTKEYVLRRELLIKEGDIFSYENMLRSQRQLLRLGIFKDVNLEPLNQEIKEYKKDISVRVEEGHPGIVEVGIGYGDVERFRGMLEGSYKNLFGTGRQITLRVEGSSIEQKYSLGYKEPWVLGYQMDGRFNIVDLIEHKRSFVRRTLGFSTGIDKSFSEFVKGSLMYQYEDVKLSDVTEEAILTPEDIGKVEVATINPSIIIDRRDDPFNPSKGGLYSITFREAARIIGSNPQFAKVILQNSLFYSPLKKLVFAFSARGGVAWNFGKSNEVPIFERYFVGGRSTVRGYDQERLGIPDKTIIFDGQKWNPTGGNMMVVLNGEIRFPLFRGLGMVVFIDSGNVWRKAEEFDLSEVRSTAGAGIRYNTPVGPLRLDIGCKLDREIGEDRCLPHFTLGHAF